MYIHIYNLYYSKLQHYFLYINFLKAFNNVDHLKLNKMLLKRNVHLDLLLFLTNYFKKSEFIRWNGVNEQGYHMPKCV